MLILLGSLDNKAIAQVGLQISARYNLKSENVKDEFPPDIFLTFLGPMQRGFNVNPEIHFDLSLGKRNWPGLGSYVVKRTTVGNGVSLNYKIVSKEKILFFVTTGVGIHKVSHALITESERLQELIIIPKSTIELYTYYTIGSAYKVSPRSLISMDFGVGLNHVSVGYAYLFKQDEK